MIILFIYLKIIDIFVVLSRFY